MSLTTVSSPLQIETAGPWYVPRPRDGEWTERARAVRSTIAKDWLDKIIPAIVPTGAAADRLTRAARDGFVVTTGQQPGLFGGPLYTWHKAMTVLELADDLQTRTGLPVAPVFWAATDDTDLAEAGVTVVNVPGGAETISVELTADRDTLLSHVPLPHMGAAFARLTAACGSATNADVLALVRRAYASDRTVGSSYVAFLRGLLEPLGVSVLDAAHPAARSAAAPLLRTALQRADAISDRVRERSDAITAAGLKPQVRFVAGRSLVFAVEGGRRARVKLSEATKVMQKTSVDSLSANVLLRPIVECSILPTVAYVGGPAEIAYFAQVSAVADALAVDAPLIVPRWSGFVLEPQVHEFLAANKVSLDELRDPHALTNRFARDDFPRELRSVIDEFRAELGQLAPRLSGPAKSAGLPVQATAIEGAGQQLIHKLERLERRLVAAVKRRGSDRLHALATARGSLFPNDIPQERALNVIPFVARYGNEVFARIREAARQHVSAP